MQRRLVWVGIAAAVFAWGLIGPSASANAQGTSGSSSGTAPSGQGTKTQKPAAEPGQRATGADRAQQPQPRGAEEEPQPRRPREANREEEEPRQPREADREEEEPRQPREADREEEPRQPRRQLDEEESEFRRQPRGEFPRETGRRDFRERGQGDALGLTFREDDEGLYIEQLDRTGLAAEVGLSRGDRVLSFDGQRIDSDAQFRRMLRDYAGQRASLVVVRDGRRHTVNIDIPPQRRGDAQFEEETARRAALGVRLQQRGDAVVVSRLYRNSPAEEAGLEPGDRIIEIDGQEVFSLREAVGLIRQVEPDEELTIGIERQGRFHELTVQLAPWEEAFTGPAIGEAIDETIGRPGEPGRFGQPRIGRQPGMMRDMHDRMGRMMDQRMGRPGSLREDEISQLRSEIRELRRVVQQLQREHQRLAERGQLAPEEEEGQAPRRPLRPQPEEEEREGQQPDRPRAVPPAPEEDQGQDQLE